MKLRLGEWYIGRVNVVLGAVQLLLWLQTGSRGLDYVQPRPDMATPRSLLRIEETLPLWVWGVGFLVAAFVLFVGVAGRWWTIIVTGHVLAAMIYGGFAAGSWMQVPMRSVPLAVVGAGVLAGGVYLAAVKIRHDWTRFVCAVVFTGIGGWVCGLGMGYDFRTTTGFVIATASHLIFAFGIAWLVTRNRQLDQA